MATVYDGFQSLDGGMNSGLVSTVIPDNQYAKGINVTSRGGIIRTRPAFNEKTLTFDYPPDIRDFGYRKYQGGIIYRSPSGPVIVLGIGGHVFMVDPRTWKVTNASLTVGRLSQYADHLYFCQVEHYLVVQDGMNAGLIFDGATGKVSDVENNEIPVGSIMAYGHGRLFVKTIGNQFLAGNINKPNDATSVLQFTETNYLSGGGAFSLPSEMGEITAMKFMRNLSGDTGTGNGPLLVFAENGYSSYHVYQSRTAWQDTDIAKVEMIGNGCTGPEAVIQINEDVMFRSWTGVRSYTLLRQEAEQKHAFTELSEEIRPFLDQETSWLLPWCSFARFQNRLLMTIGGEISSALDDGDSALPESQFKGLAVMDFSPVSGVTMNRRSPVWDGVWTGVKPLGVLSGVMDLVERAFIIHRDDNGELHLSEISDKPGLDNGYMQPNCRLYTRALEYKAVGAEGVPVAIPWYRKRVDKTAIWIQDMEGDVDLSLHVRSDQRGEFAKLSSCSLSAPMDTHDNPVSQTTPGRKQTRPAFVFPSPDENQVDSILLETMCDGYEIQFCIEWDGIMAFHKMSFLAHSEATVQQFDNPRDGEYNEDLPRNDFDYAIERRAS